MKLMRFAIATMLLGWCSVALSAEKKSVKVLIITGDHGHAWKESTPFLKDLLTKAGHQVDVTEQPGVDLVASKLAKYDVLLFNYRNTPNGAKNSPNTVWSDDNKRAFVEAIHDGKGLVMYHFASAAFNGNSDFDKEFEKLSAGGWRKQGFHGAMHEFTVTAQKDHPITRGIKSFNHGRDELYQNSLITEGSEILVTAYSEKSKDPKNTGKDEPMVWINKYGKGRVVQNALGHDVTAMASPGSQTLMIRCVEWAASGETWVEAPAELSVAK